MTATTTDREFARIDVEIAVTIRPLDEDELERSRARLGTRPSVWGPSDEGTLRDLVNRNAGDHETVLARALLEITGQVVKLRSCLVEAPEGAVEGRLIQLSGGGGRVECRLGLDLDDHFEIRFVDDDNDIPPLRAVCTVVHRDQTSVGFRFEVLHRRDEDLLVRTIYGLQRRALRRQHAD